MDLLPDAIRKQLPKLLATDRVPAERKVAVVKYFFPSGAGTWYGCEFDGADTFFGYVVSPLGPDCDEWGYFSLSELQGVVVRGLRIERDIYWTPGPIPEVQR